MSQKVKEEMYRSTFIKIRSIDSWGPWIAGIPNENSEFIFRNFDTRITKMCVLTCVSDSVLQSSHVVNYVDLTMAILDRCSL